MKRSIVVTQKSHFHNLARLPFPQGYPSPETIETLHTELQFQRAVQTYLWALPAMSLYSMRKAQEAMFGAGSNVLVIWKDRVDAKTIMIAPNPDVVYGFAWLDLKKEGPTVVEVPPQIQGLLDDAWQRPLTDVGFAGPDRGTGGKYVIVPPHYRGELPIYHYCFKSPTYGVFVLFRAFLENGRTAQGVGLLERSRIYSLARKGNPPAMQFPNASGIPISMDFPRDGTFFDNLAAFLDEEPATPEDLYMRGMAAGLGIAKGKPFRPDEATRGILNAAAAVAYKMSAVASYADCPALRTYPNRRWRSVFGIPSPVFQTDSYTSLDDYAAFFQSAYATSVGMAVPTPGRGAQYLRACVDSEGEPLKGELTYKLHIPAPVPAANYWSVVLYDSDTRTLLDNGQCFPSVASNTNLKPNRDGSADIYFSPQQPKDSVNWIATVPERSYFAVIRLYSPTLIFFGKYWAPGDIEKVK